MIKGVGIDLMNMDRIAGGMPPDDAFIRRVFTEAERIELATHADPHEYVCSRFSAKEAVFKSLGRDPDDFSMADIEILANGIGMPMVELRGKTASLARAVGISRVHVSISFDGNLVTSLAVADGTDQES